jgi:stringent starvation protein B
MLSPKPYLLRAFYDWIVDCGMTPHVVVAAEVEGTEVPPEYVQDGKIVLNILPTAIQALVMDRERLSFSARFQGVARSIDVPMKAVKAIYAKENGRGMVFPEDDEEVVAPAPESPPPRKGPSLKLVK